MKLSAKIIAETSNPCQIFVQDGDATIQDLFPTRLRWKQDMSAYWAGIAGLKPSSNTCAAHDVVTGWQAYCVLDKAVVRVLRAAVFLADDALMLLFGRYAVLGSAKLVDEFFSHGVGWTGKGRKSWVAVRN